MGKFQPLPIVGGSYSDDARPYSVQDSVNFLPVKAEAPGMRSDGILKQVPGLVAFCGTNGHPVRGAYVAEGRHFVVAGTTLYSIDAVTHAATSLGTVPGTGRVSFAHNQIAGGNQVIVVNGSQGFVWNTVTGTFSQITDVDFPGSIVARYLGQYLIGIEPKRRYWFHSDLATATSYLSTDTYEAESAPDLLVGLEVSQGRLLVLGTRTIEEWVNDPTDTSAFQRSSVIERGAASTHANVVMDNSLIWLGDDGNVYRLNGYTPTRISNHAIEQDILATGNLANAFAFGWEDKGHKVYYLTLPNGHTWGYDIASGLWHRRQSYRLDRWRANSMVLWNGDWYAGDYSNGVIYKLAWLAATECCDPLVRERTLPVLHDNENRLCVDAVALVVDVGREDATITHAPPAVTGALPDAAAGDTVSYQYTLGGGYPGEVITAQVTAGALPTGLSMSGAGLVTGTPTIPGTVAQTFTWTITATNECGDTATLSDSATISPYVSQGAQLSGWKYKQIALSDATDYSPSAYDDSLWSAGTAPFGYISPTGPVFATQYDSRLSNTIATATNLDQRLWLRRTLTITHVPPSGYSMVGYFDNSYQLYVNGVLAASGSSASSAGTTVTIAASYFVAGVNTIAVRGDDDAGTGPTDTCYFDFLLDPL